MKYRYIGILCVLIIGILAWTGCGKKETDQQENSDNKMMEEDLLYGEVSKITEDTILIQVGTLKEAAEDGDSMLDFTGEEKEIKVTGETIISRGRIGNQRNQKSDGDGQGKQRPEGMTGEDENLNRDKFQKEELSLQDIKEGDTIGIACDENGNVSRIMVMTAGREVNEELPSTETVPEGEVKNA